MVAAEETALIAEKRSSTDGSIRGSSIDSRKREAAQMVEAEGAALIAEKGELHGWKKQREQH
jgi:hypothetical protein